MKRAFRILLSVMFFVGLCTTNWLSVEAQDRTSYLLRALNLNKAPVAEEKDFISRVFPLLNHDFLTPPQYFINETTSMLYREIAKRLGVRYRFYGTDDRGYDCSGFVWRVFQSAGGDFERVAARTLWAQLPEATEEEKGQFGTLIFFNKLKHVGIVRDAKTFYHASRSQGVTLSSLEGYWGERITGYRRAPALLK